MEAEPWWPLRYRWIGPRLGAWLWQLKQLSNHGFLDGIRDSPTRLKPPRSSTDTSPMAQKVLPFLNCTVYEHYHNFLFDLSSGRSIIDGYSSIFSQEYLTNFIKEIWITLLADL